MNPFLSALFEEHYLKVVPELTTPKCVFAVGPANALAYVHDHGQTINGINVMSIYEGDIEHFVAIIDRADLVAHIRPMPVLPASAYAAPGCADPACAAPTDPAPACAAPASAAPASAASACAAPAKPAEKPEMPKPEDLKKIIEWSEMTKCGARQTVDSLRTAIGEIRKTGSVAAYMGFDSTRAARPEWSGAENFNEIAVCLGKNRNGVVRTLYLYGGQSQWGEFFTHLEDPSIPLDQCKWPVLRELGQAIFEIIQLVDAVRGVEIAAERAAAERKQLDAFVQFIAN